MFAPIGIVVGLLAGMVAKRVFDAVWGLFNDEDPPRPKHREIQLGQLVLALLIEGAIFRLVKGLVDHGMRHGWTRLTGSWPGEERPEPE
jgi:hypothetical protein